MILRAFGLALCIAGALLMTYGGAAGSLYRVLTGTAVAAAGALYALGRGPGQ